jgi:hypothetical protein
MRIAYLHAIRDSHLFTVTEPGELKEERTIFR